MAKHRIQNYVFLPGVSSDSNAVPNAYTLIKNNRTFIQKEAIGFIAATIISDNATNLKPFAVTLLTNNKTFLQEEITAWITAQVAGSIAPFVGYTFNSAKCKRDVGYVIDAYINDIRYGGNENIIQVASQYWLGGVAQVDGDRTPETVAHTKLRDIINNNILPRVLYSSQQAIIIQNTSGTSAEVGVTTTITTLSGILINVIANGLSVLPSISFSTRNFPNYIYDSAKCERDIGYVVDAYLNDIRYGGNVKTRFVASRYWTGDVPQIDGDRKPEIVTHTFIRDLIVNTILPQEPYGLPYQSQIPIYTNGDSTVSGETLARARITDLSHTIIDVITNGLSVLPAAINGVSSIKLQGRYRLDELLLITNATNNQIVYNFSDSSLGAVIAVDTAKNSNGILSDDDFPTFLQTADYITTLTLKANTASCLKTDDIQIFVEANEIRTRPFDFGTDAIERLRVAQPQSMLDADFEYGLQPTKWQAIAVSRGYPSVYEVPGTDTAVLTVTTDASAGTAGVGQSLITVTTVGPHGFIAGDPITIKALLNSVSGFSRAEGTFIITEVSTPTSFKYYSVARVGISDGQILSSTYTQLRKGAFYTGASIGAPQFSVFTNGTSGTFFTALNTITDSDQLAFASGGSIPVTGAPVTGSGIRAGTQITAVIGTGGIVTTKSLSTPVLAGATQFQLTDTTGVLEGMAVDNGSGTSVFVSSINSPSVLLTGPLTVGKEGNTNTYTNVSGTNLTGIGTGALFTVSRINGVYSNLAITAQGVNYQTGNKLRILGTALGGTSPTNDLIVICTLASEGAGAFVLGEIFSGTSISGARSFTGVSGTGVTSTGTLATFDVVLSGGVYSVNINSSNPGIGYVAGDKIKLAGTSVGGATPANDINILVNSASQGLGTVLTIALVNPGTGYSTATAVGTTGGAGTGLSVNIVQTGGIIDTVTVNAGGINYQVGNTITIAAGNNNATFTVSTISPAGAILTLTATGTGVNVNGSYPTLTPGIQVSATYVSGGLADTTLVVDSTANMIAGMKVTNPGYTSGQTIITVVNSTTLTMSAVANSQPSGQLSFTYDLSTTVAGSGFIVSVARQNGTGIYSIVINSAGINYLANETIVILGTQLGGTAPANNLTITVNTINTGGSVNAYTLSGTGITGNQTFTSVSGTVIAAGTGAAFDVSYTGGTLYSVVIGGSSGSGYAVGETIKIAGTTLGGASPVNDLVITVSTVSPGTTAGVATYTVAGTPAYNATFTGLTSTNKAPTGLGATFNVARSGGTYAVTLNQAGAGYLTGDRITIAGTALGGTTPTNDAVVRILDANPQINSVSISGLGTAAATIDFYSAISLSDLTTAVIPSSTTLTVSAIASVQITFTTPHGLIPGSNILTSISSTGTNHALAAGPFYVESTPTTNTLRYTVRAAGVIDAGVLMAGTVYSRPDSFFIHRPYDGGVQLGTGGPQHGAQAIRQSKKYIRYQSGKGIMYTTGALFAPSYNLQALTSTGTAIGSFITVTTDDVDHGCQVGGVIKIIGVSTPGYNGTYTVTDVVTERQFKIQAQTVLGNVYATLSTTAQMSVDGWHGATVRAGTFDDQNGMFWQYNGKDLSVGRRSSTFQLAGFVNILRDSNLVNGTNTRFRDQLNAGDRIVIKGMTHVVSSVTSDTQISITPDFRGTIDVTQVKLCLVRDFITPQSEFNMDRIDGTGPSGYNVDVAKMQMIGIQWSWYGAGFIDYMIRGSDGNFIFVHRIRNSNTNTEAYMRTGNMPVRYEVLNEGPPGKLAKSITASQTTVQLVDASKFPDDAGTIQIDNELISFTGKSGNMLIGCTRSAPLINFVGGAQRTFRGGVAATHEYNTGVVLVSNTISPIISHWGSAIITDGRFDEDRGYIFSYAATNISVSTTKQTAFLIRLAPSVSNAIVGDLGERELLNRAQLLLKEIAITSDTSTGGIVIEGVLNPQNYPINVAAISWSGLQGSSQGGQPSFAQIAPGGSVQWSTGETPILTPATTLAFPTGAITATTGPFGSNSTLNGVPYFGILSSDYLTYVSSGLQVGDLITGTGVPANTTITEISPWYSNFYFVRVSRNFTQTTSGTNSLTVTKRYALTNTSLIFFQKASWESVGATQGTEVSDTLFPANTRVSVVNLNTYFGTQYYRVTFSQTSSSTAITAGTTTITFKFGQPPFALPGETIFSFIAAPGTSNALDLSELKELTSSTLGGRGTYPNGPDVLAINVFKSSGAATPSNIVLRWGEAQA